MKVSRLAFVMLHMQYTHPLFLQECCNCAASTANQDKINESLERLKLCVCVVHIWYVRCLWCSLGGSKQAVELSIALVFDR